MSEKKAHCIPEIIFESSSELINTTRQMVYDLDRIHISLFGETGIDATNCGENKPEVEGYFTNLAKMHREIHLNLTELNGIINNINARFGNVVGTTTLTPSNLIKRGK